MKKKYIGDSFDSFLKEEGILEDVTDAAVKRVLAFQIQNAMKNEHLTKTEMAKKMSTSRAALNRLLEPRNDSVTLETLKKAASVVGKKIKLELV
jgi:plasmid maintenance system antidote protein VapI